MGLNEVKALTFDTGGTILDWHTGFKNGLEELGARYNVTQDWAELANEIRRISLQRMLNLGQHEPPAYNFDGAHRSAVDQVLNENNLGMATETERHSLAYEQPHNFNCWPDFPDVLQGLRTKYICASFTILSFRIIIDTARRNSLSWDAVISCEAIGKYKILPEAYEKAAHFLQLKAEECCMVACHNFDLDAAKAVGFKTAFVRRPDEWGDAGPPDPEPNPQHDIVVDSFPELAKRFGVS